MRRGFSVVVALAIVSVAASGIGIACGTFEGETPDPADDSGADAGGGADTSTDAPATDADVDGSKKDGGGPRCDTFAPFTKVGPLPGPVNTAVDEDAPRVINGGLTLVFTRPVAGINHLHIATRKTLADQFTGAVPMNIDMAALESENASFTADERVMYYNMRAQGPDLYRQSRSNTLDDFSNRTAVATINTPGLEVEPWISGSELFFTRQLVNDIAIWVASSNGAGGFTAATRLPGVNAASDAGINNSHAVVTSDGLTMYFGREIEADYDIWAAHRKSLTDPFTEPKKLTSTSSTNIISPQTDVPGWISPDECTLYFATLREGPTNYQIYVAERVPPPL